jgi:hypothetical protein
MYTGSSGANVRASTDAALAISALNDRATGWQQVGRTEFVFGTVLGTTEPVW